MAEHASGHLRLDSPKEIQTFEGVKVVKPRMTAAPSLVEPLIMLMMGVFVAFVLVSLYLPIFSLAEKIH